MTHLIERFIDILKTKRYNSLTIAAYRHAIFTYYNFFRDSPQTKVDETQVVGYLEELSRKKSHDEVVQASKAIKLFYELIFNKKLNISGKSLKDNKIPDILSPDEIRQLSEATKNLKHRMMVLLIYSTGIRLSEVVRLKVEDIGIEKKLITIHNTEEGTYRTVMLAQSFLPTLQRYLDQYKPKTWLFEGNEGQCMTSRSMQLAFQRCVEKLELRKDASINTLRHSFAVHLLEAGMDIHLLKELLGHKNLQTTSAYVDFANVQITKLKSPLDLHWNIVS